MLLKFIVKKEKKKNIMVLKTAQEETKIHWHSRTVGITTMDQLQARFDEGLDVCYLEDSSSSANEVNS